MKTWTHRTLTMGMATAAVAMAVSGCAPVTDAQNVHPPDPIDLHHGATGGRRSWHGLGILGRGRPREPASIGWEFNRESWHSRVQRRVVRPRNRADAFSAALTVRTNVIAGGTRGRRS